MELNECIAFGSYIVKPFASHPTVQVIMGKLTEPEISCFLHLLVSQMCVKIDANMLIKISIKYSMKFVGYKRLAAIAFGPILAK